MPDVSKELLQLWQVRKSCDDALKGAKAASELYHSRKRKRDPSLEPTHPYKVPFQRYLHDMDVLLQTAPSFNSLPHAKKEWESLQDWAKLVHNKHKTFDMVNNKGAIGITEASEQARDFVQAVEKMRKSAVKLCRHLKASIQTNFDWTDPWTAFSFDDLTNEKGEYSWKAEALLRGYSLSVQSIARGDESSNDSRLKSLEARIEPSISRLAKGVDVDYSIALSAKSESFGSPISTTVNDSEVWSKQGRLKLRHFFESDQVASLDPGVTLKFMKDCEGASKELEESNKLEDGSDGSYALSNAENTFNVVKVALETSTAGVAANRVREEDRSEFQASTAATVAESV